MTENTNISTSGHRQGNKIMATGEFSQRQIDRRLKLAHTRQKTIKNYLISELKSVDGKLILSAPGFDYSTDAKPRFELLI